MEAHGFQDSSEIDRQSLRVGRIVYIYHLSKLQKGIYGVSLENRYSGLEQVIFSVATSSKCNQLLHQ